MTEHVKLEKPWGKGRVCWTRDATADDSDKSFTVPTGKIWKVLTILWDIQCSATVGNRTVMVSITNGTSVVWVSPKSGNITASQKAVSGLVPGLPHKTDESYYNILDGTTAGTGAGVWAHLPFEMYLPAGYVIRVWDSAAVAAAADDMVVVIHYIEYDA